MHSSELLYMDISDIYIAHEYVLDNVHQCKYPNGRGQYGMVFVSSGEAEYYFYTGDRITVRAGDVILLSAEAAYRIITREAFRHCTVNFDIHPDRSNISCLQKRYCVLHTGNAEEYRQSFKKLITLCSFDRAESQMPAMAALYELLSLFCHDFYLMENGTPADTRLLPAKNYIEQHFNAPICLEMLSKLCDMSVTNFRREWAKVSGQTPMQYRDSIRLSYAKEYLVCGYYSVSEVAARCGFDDISYFVRFFKKHTGLTPGAFKKNLIIL